MLLSTVEQLGNTNIYSANWIAAAQWKWKEGDLNDFERGVVVGARSESPGFTERSKEEKIPSEWQFQQILKSLFGVMSFNSDVKVRIFQ